MRKTYAVHHKLYVSYSVELHSPFVSNQQIGFQECTPGITYPIVICKNYRGCNVQNWAARAAARGKRYDHMSLPLKELYWLPVAFNLIQFIPLCYHCRSTSLYRTTLLSPHESSRSFHLSRDVLKLHVPFFQMAFWGDSAFAVASPHLLHIICP